MLKHLPTTLRALSLSLPLSLISVTASHAKEVNKADHSSQKELTDAKVSEQAKAKEKAIETLFSDMKPKAFLPAIKAAEKAGVHPQKIIEAKFLYYVDHKQFSKIAKFTPELLKMRDKFSSDHSEIFAVKEDWLAIVHYAQALEALEKHDKASFKKHITEAFWLSPRQGRAFAPHIDQLRMAEKMAAITLKPSLPLTLQDGTSTTLGALMKGKSGAILHFWSPMSQESLLDLDAFIERSQLCDKNNLVTIAVLVGYNDEILKDAKLVAREDANKAKCTWAVDPKVNLLSSRLRVMDIPMEIIVTPKGKILFNGPPSKNKFWSQLQQLAPKIKKPATISHDESHTDG